MSQLNQIQQRIVRFFVFSVCVGAMWLSSAVYLPVQAANSVPADQKKDIAVERLAAVIECLPKQLSEPDLGRAFQEMGNDYLERAFQLKDDPRVSDAEDEFNRCLQRKGYELRANQNVK
ncbi:MAG: hypothetical protein ACFBSC_02000 [Microcoleaceae cyanobacterium]